MFYFHVHLTFIEYVLQSVIFIRHFTKGGFEISGYIDYAHRLVSEDWGPFFRANKMLWPRNSDLGYYHWRHGTVRSNISRNYKVIKISFYYDYIVLSGWSSGYLIYYFGSRYIFCMYGYLFLVWRYPMIRRSGCYLRRLITIITFMVEKLSSNSQ